MVSETPAAIQEEGISFANINEALNNEDIQTVIQSWEEQKEFLREQVKLFWMTNENQYKMWWLLAGEDIRRAMVLTAYEDLQQFEGPFTLALCPEFNNVEELLQNNANAVVELWEKVVGAKENEEGCFDQKDSMLTEFQKFAVQAMFCLRSNILLTFLNDIALIYQEQRNSL